MPLNNTAETYGLVTKTFHWLTALLILTLIPTGLIANALPYDTGAELARKAWLFSLHKTVGITLFFTALLRIIWALFQPKPGGLHPERRAETWAAETVHWLLYGSLVLVPLSGWIQHASTAGFAPIWWPFGQDLPLVPKSESLSHLFAGLHIVLGRVLGLALVLHVAGALKHHLVDRDATLRRMWFGAADTPAVAPHDRTSLPLVSALTAWAVAIGLGGALGAYAGKAAERPDAELAQVASEWQVQEGKIALEVTQFGSKVSGQFTDWTAAITFDPEIMQGPAGTVDVTIAIPSLSLGSVTDQALGPDFFAANDHPTARFQADIATIPDGYAATGTLTIKDRSVPVTLPFALVIEGDSALMTSSVSLDRRDFGIGDNMADESSLAFAVDITVSVTATRGADTGG